MASSADEAGTGTACATLYYDGLCPLCNAEVGRLAALGGPDLQLVDIHRAAPQQGLPTRDELLRNLHYRRADGAMLVGLDANVAAWQHTRLGPLWRWLRWPLVHPIASRAYRFWARRRYRRLYGDGLPADEA